MEIDKMTIKQIENRLNSMDGWEYRKCLNKPYEKKLKELKKKSLIIYTLCRVSGENIWGWSYFLSISGYWERGTRIKIDEVINGVRVPRDDWATEYEVIFYCITAACVPPWGRLSTWTIETYGKNGDLTKGVKADGSPHKKTLFIYAVKEGKKISEIKIVLNITRKWVLIGRMWEQKVDINVVSIGEVIIY